MTDKIKFVKWMFKNINYFYVFLAIHFAICISIVFVPVPFDKYVGMYILASIAMSLFSLCVWYPIKWAYESFQREERKLKESAIKIDLTFSTKDRYN